MTPELCEPCEITTYADLPNHVYICTRCGLDAVEKPLRPTEPVCLVKGGRPTTQRCRGYGCDYQEPHRHGFACDSTCTVCGGH